MNEITRIVAAILAIGTIFAGCGTSATPADTSSQAVETVGNTLEQANQKYIENIDLEYSYNLTKKLETYKSNEKLGYRTAGSDAEVKTGDLLFEEMKNIGLTEVAKDEFTLDTWEFEKAELTFTDLDGNAHTAVMGGYQTNFNSNGPKQYEIVYANKGTRQDLAEIDVTGKLVLVDINQSDEWWINYPTLQANYAGAVGVIAVQSEGFAEVSPDALNANDICGPADAPAFSMSQTDANKLKAVLDKNNNLLKVTLDAKSTVGFDGKAYNISGKIVGKDPESYILISAHYDSYFAGFQDDNAAIGLMMGIAKGLIDSGYQPEKTIIFNAMAAEEWGVSDTRYDWSTGAYNQIFRIHPEWQGKAVVDINFELPAYQHRTFDEIRSVYELNTYLNEFAKTVPAPEGVYPDGLVVNSPLRTWSDDFSFSIAGVPALRNDFQDSEFSRTHYHSQFDNEDTYNEVAFKFHHILYGMMVMYYDRTCVVPLDFSVGMQEMKETIASDIFTAANTREDALKNEIDAVIDLATGLYTKTTEINEQYLTAIGKGDSATAAKLYADSRSLNQQLLTAFRFVQDNFNRLTWEDEQKFAHELVTANLENLYLAVEALEAGNGDLAYDEYLWLIDNNWYAYYFDREVFDHFTNYVLDQPADRLMWGAGRVVGHVDLFDTIASLEGKYGAEKADYTTEIAAVKQAIADQEKLLNTLVEEEVADLQQLGVMLKSI